MTYYNDMPIKRLTYLCGITSIQVVTSTSRTVRQSGMSCYPRLKIELNISGNVLTILVLSKPEFKAEIK